MRSRLSVKQTSIHVPMQLMEFSFDFQTISKKNANNAEVSQLKFLCGQKGKFVGLNCQAISGVCGRVLDISIKYGGSSSDCLA